MRRILAVDSRKRCRSKSSIVLACTVSSELKTSSMMWWKPIERSRMRSERARIWRLRKRIRNAASGAKISDASVSRQEMNQAPNRQAKIRSGSVMAPP